MASTADRFFKGLSWLLVLNLLVKPLWIFGIDRQFQNLVGYETYGSYFSILSLSIVFSFLCDAGLTNWLTRELAMGKQVSMLQLLRIKTGLSAAYLALLVLIAAASGISSWSLLLAAGMLQVLTSFLLFFRGILTGRQQYGIDAWISVLDKILVILVCGSWLYLPLANKPDLFSFLLIQCGALLLSVLITVVKAVKLGVWSSEAVSLRSIVRSVTPYVALILMMGLHGRIDAFLLERIHPNGAYQAGLYASVFRLLDAGNTIGYLAASFLLPFAARHFQDNKTVDRTVLQLRHGLLLLALAAIVVALVFGINLLQWLYGAVQIDQPLLLVSCLAVLPAYFLAHIYGSLLTASGRFRQFNRIILVSLLVNLLGNLLLIGPLGALGCCLSALASQYLFGILCFYYGRRSFQLPAHSRSFLWYALAAAALFGICRLLQFYASGRVTLLLAGTFAVLIMFATLGPLRRRFVSS